MYPGACRPILCESPMAPGPGKLRERSYPRPPQSPRVATPRGDRHLPGPVRQSRANPGEGRAARPTERGDTVVVGPCPIPPRPATELGGHCGLAAGATDRSRYRMGAPGRIIHRGDTALT